jgi:hypothetical protein
LKQYIAVNDNIGFKHLLEDMEKSGMSKGEIRETLEKFERLVG